MSDRVTSDDVTGIDEIVLTGVDVHIEAMSDKGFTLIFSRHDGSGFWVQADIWAARKPLTMRLFEVQNADGLDIEDGSWK